MVEVKGIGTLSPTKVGKRVPLGNWERVHWRLLVSNGSPKLAAVLFSCTRAILSKWVGLANPFFRHPEKGKPLRGPGPAVPLSAVQNGLANPIFHPYRKATTKTGSLRKVRIKD